MKLCAGTSKNSVEEASKGISSPEFLIMIASNRDKFKDYVDELERKYPGVPSIGCVGESYVGGTSVTDGISITGMSDGITAITNVIKDVSTMPAKYIRQIQNDVQAIGGKQDNTVCIDFCSSNDECVLTTLMSVLKRKNMMLTGGTAWGGLVSVNGVVYEDSCAYAFVKNNKGRVKTYKENIYVPTEKRYIVTKSDTKNYILSEINGRPSAQVYMDELSISADKVTEQTFINPLGRCIGDEIFIVSISERNSDNTLSCFRKVNPKDVLNILELGDYRSVVAETVDTIRSDFKHVSGIFSINCEFRYLLFEKEHFTKEYLDTMNRLGPHAGLYGMGEHYNGQHTNQTMSCVVFE